ncbi:MAG TPA: hypothetical protein PKM44_00825 [Turneriella sp.]|nr:hypothetical protein [Turneriella sp.]HMY11379.1 hypothetical protein [Turneriella sp.]HNA80700.1 hypothetical protein [Turneriella sp.]HNE18628.1 hypothetical protein [Turneriella sp.]HNJ65871.1 hypothetical protein [Turneriella sp.]
MKRILITVLSIYLFVTAAHADQFAYIKPETARQAVELLAKEKEVYFFCEPCNESTGQLTKIDKFEAVDVNYEGFHEVQINGQGIDLAYTYVMRKGRWKNVAVELGLKPTGVSAEIQPIKPSRPQTAAY